MTAVISGLLRWRHRCCGWGATLGGVSARPACGRNHCRERRDSSDSMFHAA